MKTEPTHLLLTCQQVERFLMAYLEGELDFITAARFKLHVAVCSDCAKYLQSYKHTVALEQHIFENPHDEAIGQVPEKILEAILNATGK